MKSMYQLQGLSKQSQLLEGRFRKGKSVLLASKKNRCKRLVLILTNTSFTFCEVSLLSYLD